jgi:hypothetical protein
MTCPNHCPARTGITEMSGEPKKLGDILKLSDTVTAEIVQLSTQLSTQLNTLSLQRAISEVEALVHKHPEARDAIERMCNAIVVQRPEIAQTIAQTLDALEQAADPAAVMTGLETLREQAQGETRLLFSNDQCTPEFMRRAATHREVDMVDADGSVLAASVILFCDGCHHIFDIGETWHGCTHYTLCTVCHTAT